ncbi:MAG: PilT/PilU family type 4a pilus ATPase [Acidobacteria bacterium]|uniref:PilT/PilU family type 4a pilus ATPase n=1 Tax=Candidatus Polarisedimenticola svalbardensis TaxID=2886004 RepID=A0A8J6XZ20_9BACT|nr:PilT/PilU family type 4a pilus ATPase [Candidatus Polarisedimenticola svalbardensis]
MEIPAPTVRERQEVPVTGWELPAVGFDERDEIGRLLKAARDRDASDLLIVAGSPAMIRINGALSPTGDPLTEEETRTLCGDILPRERRQILSDTGSVDFAFTRPGLGRFRCNLHRQRGSWAAAIRLLPKSPPGFEELNLPPVLDRIVALNHGLVLVTGPTGSGKSTTLASMLSQILEQRRLHAITIEDPVEYEHSSSLSLVEHVEVGRDAATFPKALRAALRQDPDVLLVGEMRDPESIAMAITAAETGHLVLSTLHTGDVAQSINRIVDSFPPEQIETVRTQLSISLAAVLSQHLIPRIDGEGRVPAVEIMFATDAVRNMIRSGKIEQLRSQVGMEKRNGSIPLDHSLASLVQRKLISENDARLRARNPLELDALLIP